MDFTAMVDVAIGISVVYLGASLFATVLNEYIAQVLKLRATQLGRDLRVLVDDAAVRATLAKIPALKDHFGAGAEKRPGSSYVDTTMLARQLMGGIQVAQQGVAGVAGLVASVDALPGDSALKAQLKAIARVSADTTDNYVKAVSEWFDKSLTMLGEVHKRKMQLISIIVGLVLAVALNINTARLVKHLYHDKSSREAVAALAAKFVETTTPADLERCTKRSSPPVAADSSCARVQALMSGVGGSEGVWASLPIGWDREADGSLPLTWSAVVGWPLTALAVSLGAGFWFDLLSKVVNIRHGMRKPKMEEGT